MIVTVVFGVIGLGLMVFVHELGHFVAAKLCGVVVEIFSFGWGRKLIGFTRRQTTYQISWLPIGGYCKMKGDLAPGIAANARSDVAVEKGSFYAASPWRRMLIAAFGPVFNLVFAVLAFTLIWWIGFNVHSPDNRIILATDYTLDSFAEPPPATAAGLKTGDRVTAINGTATNNFQDILEIISVSPGRGFLFTVAREAGGVTRTLAIPVTVGLDRGTGSGRIGVYSWVDPVVQTVTPGSAASIADLRKGDRILKVGDAGIRNSIDMFQQLASKPAKVTIEYERGGKAESVPLVLMYDERGIPNLGLEFAVNEYRSPRIGAPAALARSLSETSTTIALTVRGIGLLFQGIKLRNAVAGPLRITYYIGSAASSGFQLGIGAGVVSFFRFLSFLSVVLFLMNLIPFPALDGGQIALFIAEVFRGKPVRSRVLWRIQVVGLTILVTASLFFTWSDILFFLGR